MFNTVLQRNGMKKVLLIIFQLLVMSTRILAYDSPLSIFNYDRTSNADTCISILKEHNYYVDDLNTCFEARSHNEGRADFKLRVSYTPKTRNIYETSITISVDKSEYINELMAFYAELLYKYGKPDSAFYSKETSLFSDIPFEYISIDSVGCNDTIKIRNFFEKGIPFKFVWNNNSYYKVLYVTVNFEHMYCLDFYCTIINKTNQRLNKSETETLLNEKKREEITGNIIKAFIVFFVLATIFYIFYIKIKEAIKEKKEKEEKLNIRRREQENRQKKEDYQYECFLKEITNKYGEITRTISYSTKKDDIEYIQDIIAFEQPKKLFFGKDEYNFSDILSCTLYEENKQVPVSHITRTSTGSMLGRAVIGGLTLGVAGAVVGAMTAKKETTSSQIEEVKNGNYIVKIGLRSIENPTKSLFFYNNKEKAEEVYSLIQAIISMK